MKLCEARDTGSNNTAASEKHACKRNLLTACCLKPPDKRHRKSEDGEISKDVWNRVPDVKVHRYNAFRSGGVFPISRDGSTGEDCNQGRCNKPHYDY